MFGSKKKESGVSVAGDHFSKVEQNIRSYDSVKQFQKDAQKMAKEGWYVKSQIAKHDTSVGFILGVKHEKLVVTYERVVNR